MFQSILLGGRALTLRALVVSGTLTALAFAGFSGAYAQDASADEEQASDRVLATVDGRPIYQSELTAAISELPPQYRQNLQQIIPNLVDRLIDLKLLSNAGRAVNLADDEEVQRRVTALEDQVIAQVYLERALEAKVTNDTVSDRYASEFSAATKEVHARHILLQTADEAEAVIVELDNGGDFVALAKERSTGPSGPTGGDLGFFSHEQMVAPFADAAFAMEPGSYSAVPVQTQFGFHVILVEEVRDLEAPSIEEVEGEIRETLSQETVEVVINDLRENAQIEILGLALEEGDGTVQ